MSISHQETNLAVKIVAHNDKTFLRGELFQMSQQLCSFYRCDIFFYNSRTPLQFTTLSLIIQKQSCGDFRSKAPKKVYMS